MAQSSVKINTELQLQGVRRPQAAPTSSGSRI
jgi:hypothetical protein